MSSSGSPPPPLPAWATPYLPAFEELLRVIEFSEGFVLQPLQVIGPDLAHAFAGWLSQKGHPVSLNEPLSDRAWEGLAGALLDETDPTPGGVVMVIGGHDPPAGVHRAMRLVNERRDAIVAHLGRPLFWCGPASFLQLTREEAPDFWSIRASERWLDRHKDHLLGVSRAQSGAKSVDVLAQKRARTLLAAGALDEAAAVLDGAQVDEEGVVLRAEIDRRLGLFDEGLSRITAYEQQRGTSALLDLFRGRLYETWGDIRRAKRWYQRASRRAAPSDEGLALAASLRQSALLLRDQPEALYEAFSDGVARAQKLGDRQILALSKAFLAKAAMSLQDRALARRHVDEARVLAARAAGDITVLLPGEVEEALALAAQWEKTGAPVEERALRDGLSLREGDILGRWTLLERIGKGGFATVWRGSEEESDETVAIKVLHPTLAGDPVRVDRFFRGARVMAELDHPAIVKIVSAREEDEGEYFFVMEYVEGGDLHHAVVGERVLSEHVLPLILAVGGGLGLAHARGLVHRDVKPSNILVGLDGAPKLTDFDLVGAAETTGGTRTGALGTFVYAAPEAMEKPQDADARADVFGLAMTMVFALYGKPLPPAAFRHPDAFVDKLPCSDREKAVLKKALDWDREQRYRDASAFCSALKGA